jgi:LPXTG-motif cell wall-anchored protein
VFVDSTMTPLAGVTIALIDSAGTVVSSTTTVADGSYEFAGVAAGDFTVTETQPAGYGAGLIVPGNSIAVPVAAGIGSAGNDFSESLASISGTVLVDGTLAPLGGITVTLTDSSGAVVATAVTAADGTYTFADVLAGDYTVTQSQPVGYGPGAVVPGNVIAVVVVAGVASTGNDFTEAFGMISGSVFVDGTLVPVEGVTITLAGTDASGATIELVTETDSAGNYTFTALLAGNYTIVETQPDGYMPGVTVPSNSIPVALTGGAASSVNDFSEALGTISGHVYVDGTHAPLPGVTVTLKDDTGAVVATTLTDAAGLYEFTGLTTGVYTITQTQPANWDPGAVTPNNTWTVTLDSPVSAGNDFSESSPPDVTVPSTTTPSQPTTTIGGGDLPSAGTDTASVVLVAALAAAVGVLLMLTRRRRRIL